LLQTGNPLLFIDPDGKDIYVAIWATADGNIGHAGIAIDNYQAVKTPVLDVYGSVVQNKFGETVYKTDYVKDGTVTYYDLWPATGVGMSNASNNVPASYNEILTKVSDIINTDVTGSEGYSPQGVIKLESTRQEDAKTVQALKDFKNNNPSYNGVSCNCSDFVEKGVETAIGRDLNVNESILGIYNSTTPNKLFKETKKLPNATVLKDPGDKVDNDFTNGVKGN